MLNCDIEYLNQRPGRECLTTNCVYNIAQEQKECYLIQ